METEGCLHHGSEEEISGHSSGIGYQNSEVLFKMNLNNFPLDTIPEDCESSVFSLDIEDSVYVVVRDDESSMEVLLWTVKHAVTLSTVVYLVHVFPAMKFIPTPMGGFPRRHVNLEYVNLYVTQEQAKRKLLLQRFIDFCTASEVKVAIILIEDDNVAKAIVELVANLNITKLVIGTIKSNLSKSGSRRQNFLSRSGSRRQNAIAAQVLKNVQGSCDVKIVCEGRVVNEIIGCASIGSDVNDSVYVVVREDESSMEALLWTVKHAVTSSTVVSLVHVFPVMRLIPSPMGKLPRRHVDPEHVNFHLTKEEGRRKLRLQRFIDMCVASEVKVETILIEGDNVAKAIVELVANLNITKLVLGTTKSNPSKRGSRRQHAIATQVLKNAQGSCDIKIICDGMEVTDQIIGCASMRSSHSINSESSDDQKEDKVRGLVPFMRFMPNPMKLLSAR